MRLRLVALLCAVTLLAGCGGRDAKSESASATVDTSASAMKETADDGIAVPQPFNSWGQIVGEDVEFHWIDGLRGDYNRDGSVSGLDLFVLATRFGKPTDYDYSGPGQEQQYDNCVDGNRDGVIDGLDLFTIAVHFGEKVTGYRIHRSVDGGEYAELTEQPIERTAEYDTCVPELSWTGPGAASIPGLCDFRIVAESADTTPAAEDGERVLIEVPGETGLVGLQRDAWWATIERDTRASMRSPYVGPREAELRRLWSWSLSSDYGIADHPVTNTEGMLACSRTFNTQKVHVQSWDYRTGELNWEANAPGTIDETYISGYLNVLTDGAIACLCKGRDYNEVFLTIYEPDGQERRAVQFVEEEDAWPTYILPAVTAQGNIFVKVFPGEETPERERWVLFDQQGNELWRKMGVDTDWMRNQSLLLISSGELSVIANLHSLLAFRDENEGEIEWEYPLWIDEEEPAPPGADISYRSDLDGDIYWAYSWNPDEGGNVGMYGKVSADGSEVFRQYSNSEAFKQFIPLNDGTALLTSKVNGEVYGCLYRLDAGTGELLDELQCGTWPSIELVDAEGYIYGCSDGVTTCYSPELEVLFDFNTGLDTLMLSPRGELFGVSNSYDVTGIPRLEEYFNE